MNRIYINELSPLEKTGIDTNIELRYSTTMSDYDVSVIFGSDYVETINLDKTNKIISISLKEYVFTDLDNIAGTRDITIRLGDAIEYTDFNITQIKTYKVLSLTPEAVLSNWDTEKQYIEYRLDTDIYDYTDISLKNYAPDRCYKVEFFEGTINNTTGDVEPSDTNYVTHLFKISDTVNVDCDSPKLSVSSLKMACWRPNGEYLGIYDDETEAKPYLRNEPTAAVYKQMARDAYKHFVGTSSVISYLFARIESASNDEYFPMPVWSQLTDNDNVYKYSINANGNISLSTYPNFEYTDKTTNFDFTLPDGTTTSLNFTQKPCGDPYVMRPSVEDKIVRLRSDIDSPNLVDVDTINFYCPPEWTVTANISNPYVASLYVENDETTAKKIIHVQENRTLRPTSEAEYTITIKCKAYGASDAEYDLNVFTVKASSENLYDEFMDNDNINVDYQGKALSIINLKNILPIPIHGYRLHNLDGISESRILVTIDNIAGTGTISLKHLPENTSMEIKHMSFDIEIIWESAGNHVYHVDIYQDKSVSYEENAINQDTNYYLMSPDLYYRFNENGNILFTGKIYPDATSWVNVNNTIKDFFEPNIYPFDNVFTDGKMYKHIMLQTSPNNKDWTNTQEYYFYYNYECKNYLPYNGLKNRYQVIDYYHPLQKLVFTIHHLYSNDNIFVYGLRIYSDETRYNVISIPDKRGSIFNTCVDGEFSKISVIENNTIIKTYRQKCTKSDYAVYYLAPDGSWCWMLFDGKNIDGTTVTRNNIISKNNSTLNYKNNISLTYDLTTTYLTDVESQKLMYLYNSPVVYIHDLNMNNIKRVNINTNNYSVKTHKNQGNKYFTHNIKITDAKTYEWIA